MATTKPLKIGYVLDDGLDKPDGVQQYILAAGGYFTHHGHDVRYIVGETMRQDIPGVISASRNTAWHFNGNRGTMPLPANTSRLKKMLLDEQFDILHVQMPYSPFMAHRVIKLADATTAVVGTYHIAPNSRMVALGTKGLGLVLKSSLRRFDALLSVSPAAVDFARETFGIDTIISQNMIEYPRFNEASPLTRYTKNIPTILFLGRLVPRKGCSLLLQAVDLLQKTGKLPACRVVICGKGPLESQLKAYVSNHNLQKVVEFVGFVSEADKPRYYASADIAVFPSSGGESFGIVLLEAMASGNAVVLAGDNPGYRSVLHENPELLFDPKSPEVLAEKIAFYLQNVQESNQQRRWGEEFTQQFAVSRVGAQLETIYRDALQKRSEQ